MKDYSIENLPIATEEEIRKKNLECKSIIKNFSEITSFLKDNNNKQKQALREHFVPTPYFEIYNLKFKWIELVNVITSAVFKNRVGRQMKFLVKDKNYNFIYGLVQCSSPLMNRKINEYFRIKFNRSVRYKDLNDNFIDVSTCIGTGILAKYLSGKLIILMTLSNYIKNLWDSKYKTDITFIITTALYGKASIYNRVKNFKYLGLSAGYNALFTTEQLNWIKTSYKKVFPNRIKTKKAKAPHIMRHYEHLFRYYNAKMPFYPLKTRRGVYICNILDDIQSQINYWLSRWYYPRKKRIEEGLIKGVKGVK